jgi:hypothetical protein
MQPGVGNHRQPHGWSGPRGPRLLREAVLRSPACERARVWLRAGPAASRGRAGPRELAQRPASAGCRQRCELLGETERKTAKNIGAKNRS